MLYFTEDAEKKGADVIGKIQKEFAIAMKTSNPDLDITISAGGALRNAGEDFKDLYKKQTLPFIWQRRKRAAENL